jgi:hypothetical protein
MRRAAIAIGAAVLCGLAMIAFYEFSPSSQLIVSDIKDEGSGNISRALSAKGYDSVCLEPFVDSKGELSELLRDWRFRGRYIGERTVDPHHVLMVRGAGSPAYMVVRQRTIEFDAPGIALEAECTPLGRVELSFVEPPRWRFVQGEIEEVHLRLRVRHPDRTGN